ncbi:hypothetical protein [Actinokineospora bangkokensis]|uniref:RlpA-like protein double-psi beta-barrel domain-containing protein n=1 Tax=Actinokineospora bangkokensis TaxID=1193682 RepID=A0A1Q9LQ85_9PSEU|nr:hypothetical protein [Actinokineospora bangkokensis]OLR94161.1 hypothetical protein BJP25_10160 [Actinokineospora bangkokensis]
MRTVGLVIAVLLLAACGQTATGSPLPSAPATPAPNAGEEFTVERGKAVTLAAGGPQVGYARLVQDSRCPQGKQCVWEGDATVEVTVDGRAAELHTSDRFATSAQVGRSTVRLVRLDVPGTIATLVVTGA